MKKPIPPFAIAIAAVAVVVLGWFAFVQISKDPVQTGTKTSGYGPNDMPPPPTFTIPPAPESAGGVQGGPPPPAGTMRGG